MALIFSTADASQLRVINRSKSPIIFNYYSAGKKDPRPIEIGPKQTRRFHPGPHGIDAVTWSYKPVIKNAPANVSGKVSPANEAQAANPETSRVDLSTYSVPLEVSPIRIGQSLIIYEHGEYYYTLDCKRMKAAGSK